MYTKTKILRYIDSVLRKNSYYSIILTKIKAAKYDLRHKISARSKPTFFIVFISGYNFSTYSQYRGSEDLCKENYIATYVAYTDVIKIKFNRGNGQGYNSKYSGFVAGYVMYGKYYVADN